MAGSAGAQGHTQFQVHVDPDTVDVDGGGAAPAVHPAAPALQVQFHTQLVGTAGAGATATGLAATENGGLGAAVVVVIDTGPVALVWVTGPSLPGLKILTLRLTLLGTACAAAATASSPIATLAGCAAGAAGAAGAGAPPCGRSALTGPAAVTVASVAPNATAREGSSSTGGRFMTSDAEDERGIEDVSFAVLLILLSAGASGGDLGAAAGGTGGSGAGADAAATALAVAAAASAISAACAAAAAAVPS
jgi:hypothetical protein